MAIEWSTSGQPGDPALRPSWKSRPRKSPLSPIEHAICSAVVGLRASWGISQSQFARMLSVSVRMVKRWEAHRCKPTQDVREWLGYCQDFIAGRGLDEFRERFVREEPRRGKSGPAQTRLDLDFDARLAEPVRRVPFIRKSGPGGVPGTVPASGSTNSQLGSPEEQRSPVQGTGLVVPGASPMGTEQPAGCSAGIERTGLAGRSGQGVVGPGTASGDKWAEKAVSGGKRGSLHFARSLSATGCDAPLRAAVMLFRLLPLIPGRSLRPAWVCRSCASGGSRSRTRGLATPDPKCALRRRSVSKTKTSPEHCQTKTRRRCVEGMPLTPPRPAWNKNAGIDALDAPSRRSTFFALGTAGPARVEPI
jgi:hypothetical protein